MLYIFFIFGSILLVPAENHAVNFLFAFLSRNFHGTAVIKGSHLPFLPHTGVSYQNKHDNVDKSPDPFPVEYLHCRSGDKLERIHNYSKVLLL